MKTRFLSLLMLGISMTLCAQIRQIEYGWDTDKGHGLNTVTAVSGIGVNADVNLNIPMAGLSNGYHMLFVRTQDAQNRWSHTYLRLVNVRAGNVPANIVRLDYFYSQTGTTVGQYTYTLPNPAPSVQVTIPGDPSKLTAGQTYTLSIWATDANGTRSQVYSQAFTYRAVDCKNLTVNVSGIDKFCKGGSTILTAAVSGGNSPVALSWTRANVEVSKAASVTANVGTTYTVKATDAQGCVSTTSIAVTEISNLPTVSLPATASFCAGQSVVLTATGSSGTAPYNYAWKLGTSSVGTAAGTLSVNAGGTYGVTATDANGCVSTAATATVTQRPAPLATAAASAPGFTTGSSVTLTANTGTGLSYQWTRDGQPIAGATGVTYTASQPGTYAVVVAQDGCSTTATGIGISLITATDEPLSGPDFTLSASPNPSAGAVQVRLTTASGRAVSVSLTILDVLGRTLFQRLLTISGQHIEQIELPASATYLIRVASDQQQNTLRLLRQ